MFKNLDRYMKLMRTKSVCLDEALAMAQAEVCHLKSYVEFCKIEETEWEGERAKLRRRIAELETILRKVRERAVNMDPFTLNEVNEALND